MRGYITYFFGEREMNCASLNHFVMWGRLQLFGRASLFVVGSVLMGYGIWVISFMVLTYITEITPKHLLDSFTIINQLKICCRRSLIIQLSGQGYSLESMRNFSSAL